MTTALLVAVVLLAALTVLNLILVLGVVRRLRTFETAHGAPSAFPPVLSRAVGERIDDFGASTVDERGLSRGALSGRTLFGFFSTDCSACHERLGDFRSAAARHTGDAVAVVVREGSAPEPLLAGLTGVAVVVEDPDGPVARAFGVRGFPAFVLVNEDGIIESTGIQVPVPA
jgi:hypothetical protein